MVDLDDEDEEETPPRRGSRPAYLRDTYTASFRAVPGPHSGHRVVRADDTLGSMAECWCGLPSDHDWAGKSAGRKHPKGTPVQDAASIDRNTLRGYHHTIQEFILHEIRVNNLRFRVKDNSVLLYPPDGSEPMSVWARNSENQLRALGQWHTKHVEPSLGASNGAAEVDVEHLAEVINDPVEHPQKQTLHYQETPTDPADYLPPAPEPRHAKPEWVQYIGSEGNPIEGIETNGVRYRCFICMGTTHPLDTDNAMSIGGHRRMWHAPDSTDFRSKVLPQRMAHARAARKIEGGPGKTEKQTVGVVTGVGRHPFTPEDYKAAGVTRSTNAKRIKQSRVLLAEMCAALDFYPVDPSGPQVLAVDAAGTIAGLQVQVLDVTRRAEEAEAKLALLREAMGL